MRVSNDFIVREIAGETLLIPTGDAALNVKGLIALSESGSLLFHKLQCGCMKEDLLAVLLTEYDVSEEIARVDLDDFLNQMNQLGILLED